MTIDEYTHKVYVQLALLHGFSFNPEAGRMPYRAHAALTSQIHRHWSKILEGLDGGHGPDIVAAEIRAAEGGRL